MTGYDVPASMPERIGRYELLFPIGTGGMGTVYLGRAEVLPGVSRNVAVKLMHGELRANPEIAPQLMREAKLAASIVHPNVVKVLEAGDTPHGVYLVMDHVEGDTLAGLIRAARKREELVPLPIAGKILHDALMGLHAAHELTGVDGAPLELVHRDFSPHNILVGVDGKSLLTDFGIAKALSHVNVTSTGIIKGKVGYMAPEQARGERVDRRSDVWAAGVVAWELFTSRRLFRAANDAATLFQVVSGKRPPRLSTARPDVPAALDEAVAAALEPRAQRRTATAQALRKQLEDALASAGGVADEDEVAEYVGELIGDRLSQTRDRAASVLALRKELHSISEATREDTVSSTLGTPPDVGDFHEVSSTENALTAVSGARRKTRRRPLWGVAAAAMGVAVLLGVFLVLRAPVSPAAGASTALEPSASSDAVSPSAIAAAGAPVPATSRGALKLSANVPVAQLVLDGRTVVLPSAVTELLVPLDETAPAKLTAITEDGRKLELTLTPGQTAVQLEFPAQLPTAAAAPAPPGAASLPPTPLPPTPLTRPKPPSPAPAGDGLADSPYGAK